MSDSVQREYDVNKQFIEWAMSRATDLEAYFKHFFPNSPEEEPSFWDWVSYGFTGRPSPEFIDRYHEELNWEILSKYYDFGVISLSAAKRGHDDEIEFGIKGNDTLRKYQDRIDLRFVLITYDILHTRLSDREWLLEHFGRTPVNDGRDLLRLDLAEFTQGDQVEMWLYSKRVIQEAYACLERQLRDTDPQPAESPTDIDVLWERYTADLRKKLHKEIVAEQYKAESGADAIELMPWFYSGFIRTWVSGD